MSMEGISGSPYGWPSDEAATQDARIINDGLLALAYEQRTANLIALMQHAAGFSHGGGYAELYAEVEQRLGRGK